MEMTRAKTVEEAVTEIMGLHRTLPPRPGLEEVEAAKTLIRNLEKDDQQRLEAIAKQNKGTEVPEELFFVLLEMQRSFILFQSKEQNRKAAKLLDLEPLHTLSDDLIQRDSQCVSSPSDLGAAIAPPSTSLFSNHSSTSLGTTITSSTGSDASGFESADLSSAAFTWRRSR